MGAIQLLCQIEAPGLPVDISVDYNAARMTTDELQRFAKRYAAAWSSQKAASVAEFFSPAASLQINDAKPSVGRSAIAAAAQSFMTELPDMVVTMDSVSVEANRAVFRWTLRGTNSGPGGSSNRIHISGYEEWTIGADGLIADSKGHFDAGEYQRQLNG
jgi:hypothetical protein